MYTNESTNKFTFRDIVLQVLFIALFIFILLWLFPMKGDFKSLKKSVDKLNSNSLISSDATGELNLSVLYDRIFNENIIAMKDAAKSYYTTPRLPQKVGDTVKMTLGDMLSKKIILPFVDKNGKTCDVKESYVEITKYDDEFVMKVNLKCSDQENYLLIYMGCYDYCQTAICEKNKTDIKTPVVYQKQTTAKKTTSKKTTSKKTTTKTYGNPTCSLTVQSGKLGSNGAYTSDVVVKFKSKNAGTNATLNGYGLGTSTNYNGASTYKVTKDGTTTIYGYVKNSAGKTGKCSITIKKATVSNEKPVVKNPTCSLKVVKGTLGDNKWYKSDVVIGFASKSANTKDSKIVGYGLGTSTNYNNNSSYTINKDGTYTIYGYVKDSNGNVGNCNITVKRDATKPTCTIGIGSGSMASDGMFVSDVVMGFKTRSDATSGVATYGLGTSKNYSKASKYTATGIGTHTLNGYVKDNAGNENVCSRTISIRNQKVTTKTCSWSDWSSWSTTKYTANDNREVRYRTVIKGYNVKKIQDTTKPIFKTKSVYVGSTTTKVCEKYSYTGTITYSSEKYVGRTVSSTALTSTKSVTYKLIARDDYFCKTSSNCTSGTFYVYDVYKKTPTTKSGSYSCSQYKTITNVTKANKTVLSGYETKEEKTPVYETQYSYRTKSCSTTTK